MQGILIALLVILAILLLLASLLFLPIYLVFTAKEKVSVHARVGPVRIGLYPQKKRKKPRKPRRKKVYKDKRKVTGIAPIDKKIEELSLRDEPRLLRSLLASTLRRRRKWLKLRAAKLHIRVATGDAAETAILYGVVCQSLSYLLALLDRVAKVKAKEPDVQVIADFEGERPSTDVKIVLSLKPIDVILAALALARADKEEDRKKQTAVDEKGN